MYKKQKNTLNYALDFVSTSRFHPRARITSYNIVVFLSERFEANAVAYALSSSVPGLLGAV